MDNFIYQLVLFLVAICRSHLIFVICPSSAAVPIHLKIHQQLLIQSEGTNFIFIKLLHLVNMSDILEGTERDQWHEIG